MASTYSSNLKLQLMATGENSTTWGAVTNTNLGTALEEAIVGSADVTFSSADTSISLSNSNATQAARHLRLNLTGTTGGSTRTLTVPDIEKAYLVNNACADTVQVANSTGTNVAVPAGKTMWVYSTGSNVVDATTHLTSLTLGTALAPAQGGTGLTAAGTSGNVLISDGSTWTSQAFNPATILQVLQTVKASEQTINTTSKTDLSMDLAITPSSATNKILLFLNLTFNHRQNREDSGIEFALYVDDVLIDETVHNIQSSSSSITNAGLAGTAAFIHLDSPATTSEVTYSVQASSQFVGGDGSIFYPGTSTLTAMEIVA